LIDVEGRTYVVGGASGDDNNCLIDTLRQKLPGVICNLNAVRNLLRQHFGSGAARVTAANYLELEHHWWHVLQFLGTVTHRAINPDLFRVACVDLAFPGHGDVVGTGPTILHIARVGTNHFVPLLPHYGPSPGHPAGSCSVGEFLNTSPAV